MNMWWVERGTEVTGFTPYLMYLQRVREDPGNDALLHPHEVQSRVERIVAEAGGRILSMYLVDHVPSTLLLVLCEVPNSVIISSNKRYGPGAVPEGVPPPGCEINEEGFVVVPNPDEEAEALCRAIDDAGGVTVVQLMQLTPLEDIR